MTMQTFLITDGHACRAKVTNYGARLMELWVPDVAGELADIVLGFDKVEDYVVGPNTYFGATCGRYANRIANGRFTLDGRTIQIDQNEGANALHGGRAGFDKQLWSVEDIGSNFVTFELASPDGDMGFAGAVTARATYTFSAPNTLEIAMTAKVSGEPTVLNLVNHAYFNMAGQGSGPIDGQMLQVNADQYLPVDAALLPLGAPAPVAGTPFDFRELRPIGSLVPDGGFDHNLCLSEGGNPAIIAQDPKSGRKMQLWTNQPGVQFYTGWYIPENLSGKAGAKIGPRSGFTLETQLWPDSPNRPAFPSTRIAPGDLYNHFMRFQFGG